MLLDRVIAGCFADEVDEIVSLGNTLQRWRTQTLAHHLTGASNGPTEAMNLLREEDQALRTRLQELSATTGCAVLLRCGGIKWDAHPSTTMRGRSPQLVA